MSCTHSQLEKRYYEREPARVPVRTLLHLTLVALIAILLPPLLCAQSLSSDLTGTVTDQSGAAVPGVDLTATNTDTNFPYHAQTDSFRQLHLYPSPAG